MTASDIFYHRSPSSFDFSEAPIYRKISILQKSDVEIVTQSCTVVTRINNIQETHNQAKTGDYIITGPKAERYVLSPQKFAQMYAEDPANPMQYIAQNVIRAIRLDENTELIAPWGMLQRALKGGYVAQNMNDPADIYLIEEGTFNATFVLIDTTPQSV